MKRYRAVDVPPKFRRTVKGRSARLGESVYFNRFFSAYNLVYLKFFLMWVGCITLDFLIGFRFELLWPVWLLVRHLYESFRVHAFSSSLHYSAFSVFFVCVTATSDLVCYLFIPIQVLIFLASTYVWVQFVYQSSDRGVCLPSLFLWALFIVFEYSVRYRFDNATWYLTRTSWITAGLFPSTADSVSVGTPSSAPSASSTRLELYRPFAAHCIGFPVVTLGFRVKSFFSNWRMRIRREEVRRQNEFYERILADAIPTSFENRKHFISSRSHLSIEQQEAIDYDTAGGFSTSDLLNGFDGGACQHHPRLYPSPNVTSLAAICAPSTPTSIYPSSPFSQLPISTSITTNANHSSSMQMPLSKKQKQQQQLSKQSTTTNLRQHHQNGSTITKKNGGVSSGKYFGNLYKGSQIAARQNVPNANTNNAVESPLLSREDTMLHKLYRICCLFVLSTVAPLLSTLTPSFQQTIDGILTQLRGNNSSQDDLISTSGEGSNAAEEDDWDCDSNLHFNAGTSGNLLQSGKRKSKRPRGFSTLSQASIGANNDPHHSSSASNLGGTLKTTTSSSSVYGPGTTINGDILGGGGMALQSEVESNNEIKENILKIGEMRNLQKEKQTLEQSLEKVKIELKQQRNNENELRIQLQQTQQHEQQCRTEWKQFEKDQKQKMEHLENKCRQLAKQNEHFKTNIQALEKRVGELQLRKLEIERELANERLMKQQQQYATDQTTRQENGEQFKQKLSTMDRELKQLKREMKAKDDACSKLEEEVHQLRTANNDENQLIETLKEKNRDLEQTLSKENRFKQDLFRALNDSKAEIATIKGQLRANKTKEQADMMNAFSSVASNSIFHGGLASGGGGSSSGSSPTQMTAPHQQTPCVQQPKSLTPPPYSVGTSTFNLEQLLQATQNMSYSLGPLDSNGSTPQNENSYANAYGNGSCVSSSSYIGNEASEMLAVGGHRVTNNNSGTAKKSASNAGN